MTKILITGTSGFLGRNLFRVLSNEHHITRLNRNSGDININLKEEVPVFKQDFDLVIHSAGKAHQIARNKSEAVDFFDVNVLGTSNLLNGLDSTKLPKQFVFISSVAVYGRECGIDLNEDTPLAAEDPYGLSKIKAEQVVKHWCETNGIKYTILRMPLIAGYMPPGNLRSMIDAIKSNYYFNISNGGAKKSIVLVDDVSSIILKAAEVGGIYNLTDGYHPNFNELSHCIAGQLGKKFVPNMSMFFAKLLAFFGDIMGSKFPINSDKLKKITSTLTFDDSKARKAFNWNPDPVLKGFKINE